MKFTVKRSKWLRGEGAHASSLLRTSDGKMCCLGFRALACGHTKAEIGDKTVPSKWRMNVGYAVAQAIMMTNDSSILTEREREISLTAKFSELGDEIVFVD